MEKLITRKEAAKILGISIATLDAARQNGLISYVQYVPNGCVYFTNTALQEYVAKCTKRARPAETSMTYRKKRYSKNSIHPIPLGQNCCQEVIKWQGRKKKFLYMEQ